MWNISYIFLCSLVVAVAESEVQFQPDRPYLRVKLHSEAKLECCYGPDQKPLRIAFSWFKQTYNHTWLTTEMNATDPRVRKEASPVCGTLSIAKVGLKDTGMYFCRTNHSELPRSHGTYVQVYRTIDKTINLSEKTKNGILMTQGFLLLLCVLVPSFTLLCQSRRLQELEKKKALKEEENIYQGLTLDDRSSTYDQIERSQNHGPYEDVCNNLQEDIQLEKP